jgi:S-disulfanyl-L-cysteine oxidoreductase SoxD
MAPWSPVSLVEKPLATIGLTRLTIFDYVRRSMPFDMPGSLTDNEVYALTAYLLFMNEIISEDSVITAENLAAIVMPNVKAFAPDDRESSNFLH